MTRFKQLLLSLAFSAGLLSQAHAVAIPADGQWHSFDVDSLIAQSGGLEWIDLSNGAALTFDFTIGAGSQGSLTVVDGGFAGDTFKIFNGATLLGTTSAAINSYPDSVALDFDAALADNRYSRGIFLLGPGSYSIGGLLDGSVTVDGNPLDATVGALQLQVAAVPEPSESALILAGLGLMGFVVRRRSK